MRAAYLITAYNDPLLLNGLAAVLGAAHRDLFIHIDAKSDVGQFDLPHLAHAHFLEDRVRVHWGNVSMLTAAMRLLEEAVGRGAYDYYVLLSGSDFPIKPVEAFERFLDLSGGRSFHTVRPALNWFEGRKRLRSHYRLEERTRWGVAMQRLRFLQTYLGPWGARTPPADFDVYYSGSTWFTVHRDVAHWMLDCWARPSLREYFSTVYCADEIFIPTVIANSPSPERHEHRSIRLLKWRGMANPKVLDMDDLADIRASDAFFARKFSSVLSRDLLAWLAREVHGTTIPGLNETAASEMDEARGIVVGHGS